MAPTQRGMPDSEEAVRLGAAIRALRKRRGMTVAALAAATDLSHPFISQLERGIHQPSLGSLRRIAFALETSAIELIAAAEPPMPGTGTIEVKRSGEGEMPDGFSRDTAWRLARGVGGFHPMEVEVVRRDPGPSYTHVEAEFVYLLRGTVVIELDGARHELHCGDSTFYAGGVAHRWWLPAEESEPARLVVVKEAPRR